MRTLAIKFITLGLFLFSFFVIKAQKEVTIDECQQWAVAQSSANYQKELNEQLLKVKINDACSYLYPTLEINGRLSYQSDVPQLPSSISGIDTLSKDQYRISLDFSQVIFDGFKFYYGRQYERLVNKEDIYKVEISINKLKEQIISIYLNLLIINKQLNILNNAANALDKQITQFHTMLKEGVIYGNTIAQLELEMLKIEQNQGELNAKKHSLISSLSILTGKDLSNVIFVMPNLSKIEENTNSSRLEYDIFENKKASLDYQRKLHVSNSLPKISIFATGGYGRPNYNFFNNHFDWYYMVGVRFNVPVIDWAKTSGVSNIINLQKSIVASQESDFEKANKIAIQEKLNEIKRIQELLVLDNKINQKHKSITETFSIQLLNGTITAFDYLKQQTDEIQSLINQEVHTIELLKVQYELLGLKGML